MYNWKELVERAKNNDQKAMLEIITAFEPLITSLKNQKKNAIIADDVPSICYLEIIEEVKAYPYSDYSGFQGFIKRCLQSRLIKEWNKQQNIYSLESANVDDNELAEPVGDSFEDDLIENLGFKELIKDLPPAQKRVIILFFYYGYNCEEIAKLLKVSPQAVLMLKNKGMNNVKKTVLKKKKYGFLRKGVGI